MNDMKEMTESPRLAHMADSAGRQVGDRVLYAEGWGDKPTIECTITSVGRKDGRLVYDNSLGHWGFAYQYLGAPA